MRRFATAALAVGAIVAAVAVLTVLLAPFLTVPATCVEAGCFCEATSGIIPEQLWASLSSFTFVVLGVVTLWMRSRPLNGPQPQARTRERRVLPLLGATLIFIGVSSFIYHATLSFVGQFLDILSMYTFGLLLILGALYRSSRLNGGVSVVIFVVLTAILAVVQYLYPDARRVLFAVIVLPGVVLELTRFVTGRPLRERRFAVVGLGVMVLAYLIWLLDQVPQLCDPNSLIQGHAIWHVLSAVAAFMIVLHYRATAHVERAVDRAPV